MRSPRMSVHESSATTGRPSTIRTGMAVSVVSDSVMDESEGKPCRWNTLRAMRVLHWYEHARQ
ncbi:MAG: hypothetical protein ACR2JP_11000 [Acidimicrobiia bacterium]